VPLHMLELELAGPALARLAHARGLDDGDEGYLLHLALRGAFGALAPQPFRAFAGDGDRPPRLLGYAGHDHRPLAEALAVAEPSLARVFPHLDSREMPESLRAGAAYGFEVRVCPLARLRAPGKSRAGTDRRGRARTGTREVDLFLKEAWSRPGEEVDRGEVYRRWLEARLAEGGGEMLDGRLHRFEQAPLVRRRHAAADGSGGDGPPRRLHRVEEGRRTMARRPDATFRGTLRVADPDRFAALLARGVGRHRAFGFGMLLLRPPPGRS
jgi:CRISPR system Cascade subunit CasE